MYYMIGVIMLAIGVFIILFGLINDGIGEVPCYITSMGMGRRNYRNANNSNSIER